jgi:hypothetical protein
MPMCRNVEISYDSSHPIGYVDLLDSQYKILFSLQAPGTENATLQAISTINYINIKLCLSKLILAPVDQTARLRRSATCADRTRN